MGTGFGGLGDPDRGAVLVTGLYFLTGVVCLVVARRLSRSTVPLIRAAPAVAPPDPADGHAPSSGLRPPSPPASGEKGNGEARFWLVLAVMLFCLGVNKQADLQSLLTLYGRDLLQGAGLRDVRRPIQVVFIVGVAVVASFSVALGLWLVRRWSWPCRFAAVGLGIQAAFIVVRATSFHHVDRLLGLRLGDLKINLLLESIGLMVILWAAMLCWVKERSE